MLLYVLVKSLRGECNTLLMKKQQPYKFHFRGIDDDQFWAVARQGFESCLKHLAYMSFTPSTVHVSCFAFCNICVNKDLYVEFCCFYLFYFYSLLDF